MRCREQTLADGSLSWLLLLVLINRAEAATRRGSRISRLWRGWPRSLRAAWFGLGLRTRRGHHQGTRLTRHGNSFLRHDRANRARLAILNVDLLTVVSAERKSQIEERSRREEATVHVETTRTSKRTGDWHQSALSGGSSAGDHRAGLAKTAVQWRVKQVCLLRACASM